jgi:uncharacterized membrane protein YfbV (UPF0208 family)
MTIKPLKSSSWIQIFKSGHHYMKVWPLDKRLAPFFPEVRVVKMTRFAIRFMPPLAIFSIMWQVVLGGQFGPALATALFACSLPIQGIWWLGRRSEKPLPPSLLQWFYQVRSQLADAGLVVAPVEDTPTYQALADILKQAFNRLDRTFLDHL